MTTNPIPEPGDELVLKPCPFCGGKAMCSPCDDSGEIVYAVACMSCEAQITKCDEAGAIEQWNARAAIAAMPELTELQQRVKQLEEGLRPFAKLDECAPHVANLSALNYVRSGKQYTGPSYGQALEAARPLLSDKGED